MMIVSNFAGLSKNNINPKIKTDGSFRWGQKIDRRLFLALAQSIRLGCGECQTEPLLVGAHGWGMGQAQRESMRENPKVIAVR